MTSLKLLLTGILFVSFASFVEARKSSSDEAHPHIEFTNLETGDSSSGARSSLAYKYRYNFGTVIKEPNKKMVLDGSMCYTNSSDIPLIISDVIPSCGCTSLEAGKDWTREPLLKEMGERCIRFKVQVEENQYTLVKKITVVSNAKPEEITIPIIARFITQEEKDKQKK